ncbi:MAG: hypothetical protein JRG96_19175, partial [Deltaproteobacteria bacterium]|nr:hypothetical protein [Deltaproteobacteria bacterium]
AQATLALQGVQGQGADDPCCTRIEPADPEVELEVFGEVDDGWSVLTSAADYDALKVAFPAPGVYIILSLEACGATTSTTIVGCADQGGDYIVVDVVDDDNAQDPKYAHNLEGLGITIAHERGHNVGLAHSFSETCLLMDEVVGGGCMISFPECMEFRDRASHTGAPCTCMDSETKVFPPVLTYEEMSQLPDTTACSDPEGGVCSGGVCGDPAGDAGVTVFAVGDWTPGPVGEPLSQSPSHFRLSGLTGGWSRNGGPTPSVDFTGLAHARSRDISYAVGPGSGDEDHLMELNPTIHSIESEQPLSCSDPELDCAPITALAWDEDIDRLYGVEIDVYDVINLVDWHESTLVSIDPDTAMVTERGRLSYLVPGGLTGLAYDDVAKLLYGASQADIIEIDLSACGPGELCPWSIVTKTNRLESALTVDPASGRLYLTGRSGSGLSYRVIDPAAPPHFETGLVEPDFKVRLKLAAFGGLAARGSEPVPEPGAWSMSLAAFASLGLLARRRRT